MNSLVKENDYEYDTNVTEDITKSSSRTSIGSSYDASTSSKTSTSYNTDQVIIQNLFETCSDDKKNANVAKMIEHLNLSNNPNMSLPIDLLKSMFNYECCISSSNFDYLVDYDTFSRIVAKWLDQLRAPENNVNISKELQQQEMSLDHDYNDNSTGEDSYETQEHNLSNNDDSVENKHKQIRKYSNTIENYLIKIEKYEDEIKQLNLVISNLKSQLENAEEHNSQLTNDLDAKCNEVESYKRYVDSNRQLQSENEDLKSYNINLEQAIKSYEIRLDRCECDKKDLNDLVNKSNEQIRDTSIKIERLSNQIEILEKHLKEQVQCASKYEQTSAFYEKSYNETVTKFNRLSTVFDELNEQNKELKEENRTFLRKLNDAYAKLATSNIRLLNNNNNNDKNNTIYNHNANYYNNDSSYDISNNVLNHELASNYMNNNNNNDDDDDYHNINQNNKNSNTVYNEFKKASLDENAYKIEQINLKKLNDCLGAIESLELQYEIFVIHNEQYFNVNNVNEETIKFVTNIEDIVRLIVRFKLLFDNLSKIYNYCANTKNDNEKLLIDNKLLKERIKNLKYLIKQYFKITKQQQQQNQILNNKDVYYDEQDDDDDDDGFDCLRRKTGNFLRKQPRKSYSLQDLLLTKKSSPSTDLVNTNTKKIKNLKADKLYCTDSNDIETAMETTTDSTTLSPSNGTLDSSNDSSFDSTKLDEYVAISNGINGSPSSLPMVTSINLKDHIKIKTKTNLKAFNDKIDFNSNDDNDCELLVDKEETNSKHISVASQTECIRRSRSLPNLDCFNNKFEFYNSFHYYFGKDDKKIIKNNKSTTDESTQTTDISFNDSCIKLTTSIINRHELCQQFTKDSGIDLHHSNNKSSSKTNSNISTPSELDTCDLVIVSSTRNNSLDHQDDSNKVNEQQSSIGGKALNSVDVRLSKYLEDEGVLGTAFQRRNLFKNSHRKNFTIPATNYENVDAIFDDNQFKNMIDTCRATLEGTQPVICQSALSKAATKLHYDDESHNQLDISHSSSIVSLDSQLTQTPSQPHQQQIVQQGDDEHSNLKQLELLFNEIAMAHYSDQKTLEHCINAYQDKYHKADRTMNSLFENLSQTLAKILNIINNDWVDDKNELVIKKKLQENLSNIHNTFKYLKQNLISVITASSTISGLKQEAHMGELIRIVISYTRELRKASITQMPFNRLTTTKSKLSATTSQLSENTINNTSNSSANSNVQISAKKDHASTINHFNHQFSNTPSTTNNEDKSNNNNNNNRLKEMRAKYNSKEHFNNMSNKNLLCKKEILAKTHDLNLLGDTDEGFNQQQLTKLNETSMGSSTITTDNNNNNNDVIPKSSSLSTIKSSSSDDKIQNANNNNKKTIKFNIKNELFNIKDKLKANFTNSFKSIRLAISALLIIFSIIIFIIAMYQDKDVFQQLIHLFIENIEITNSIHGRPL